MKMSDVKVGMRLHSTVPNTIFDPITVTEITERGFKYSVDEALACIPRLGLWFEKEGHEYFGIDGEVFYEPLCAQAGG